MAVEIVFVEACMRFLLVLLAAFLVLAHEELAELFIDHFCFDIIYGKLNSKDSPIGTKQSLNISIKKVKYFTHIMAYARSSNIGPFQIAISCSLSKTLTPIH